MYTDVKNVRVLIALLKEYNISDAVLSSGTCSIPVLQSLEADTFFNCYSDIDERSSVYFAIGISQMKQKPVAVVCTSGTAASNYLPGVCEAKKLGVPLIIITCDKNPHTLGHLTIQKINQHNIYGKNCKFYATVPVIKDKLDEWAVKTYITQAILECVNGPKGPVHLNIYTDGDKKTFNTPDLPKIDHVYRYDYFQMLDIKESIIHELNRTKRILVIIGEGSPFSKTETELLDRFCEQYGAVVLAEHVANIKSKYALNSYRYTEQIAPKTFISELKPDLIITMGGNYASYEIKTLLQRAHVKHWWVDPAGELVDLWRSIHTIFECNPSDFFREMIDCNKGSVANSNYYQLWKRRIESTNVSTNKFSSLYVVGQVCKHLDGCKLLHLGILNSTRLVHLFDIPSEITTYSNLGALGIDGSLSSFLGQMQALKEGFGLCILGDLSFIYDINSLYGCTLSDKTKIILLNNGGGSEFHLNTGIDVIPTLDNYISAGHTSKASEWAKALGFDYYCLSSINDVEPTLERFFSSKMPSFLEVFSNMETDANVIKEMYQSNGYSVTQKQTGARLRKILIKTIGIKKTQKIVKIAKIWREE